jgi:glucose/arabinose dehydrogenase
MRKTYWVWASTVAAFAFLAAGFLAAQQSGGGNTVLTGPAAFGDWRQDRPGLRRLLRPEDLPAPSTPQSAANFSRTVPMPAEARPNVPPGFSVDMIASGLNGPRTIRVAPNGDVFVAETHANTVRVYRMSSDSAKVSASEVFLRGGLLYQPFGIAFYPLGPDPQWVYIGNSDSLVRVLYETEI